MCAPQRYLEIDIGTRNLPDSPAKGREVRLADLIATANPAYFAGITMFFVSPHPGHHHEFLKAHDEALAAVTNVYMPPFSFEELEAELHPAGVPLKSVF